jgi:hypothetical protein
MKAKELAKRYGWRHLAGNLFAAQDGSKRAIYTHHEGKWFGLSFSTWESLRADKNSQVHLVGPRREVILNRTALELITPLVSKSPDHFNLNVTKEGAIRTKKGPVQISVR